MQIRFRAPGFAAHKKVGLFLAYPARNFTVAGRVFVTQAGQAADNGVFRGAQAHFLPYLPRKSLFNAFVFNDASLRKVPVRVAAAVMTVALVSSGPIFLSLNPE